MSLVNDTWPPTYDDTYLPDPKDRHWFQDRETMDPEEREGNILKKIRAQMAYAYQHAPLYRIKWKAAGLEPDDIKTLEDFHKVPVLTKQEIRQDQQDPRPSEAISVSCPPRSTESTEHQGRRANRRPTESGGRIGAGSPMPMPGSCGGWACGPAIPSSSAPSSVCISGAGGR